MITQFQVFTRNTVKFLAKRYLSQVANRWRAVLRGGVFFCLIGAQVVFAQTTVPIEDAAELSAEVKQKLDEYQQCVIGVMSSFDSAVIKRQKIIEVCYQPKNNFIASFPESIQVYVDASISARLEHILLALEQSEMALAEVASDANELALEIETLSEEISSSVTE